ncbi:MAG: hypothetical protein AB1646_14670 [Thermodesulfobacteriota bacterium]
MSVHTVVARTPFAAVVALGWKPKTMKIRARFYSEMTQDSGDHPTIR